MLKQRRCTFRILREATEIQLLTNLAFKITEFRAELPISCSQHEAAPIGQHKSGCRALKNRFHSQLLPLNTHFWILLSFTSQPAYKAVDCAKPHFTSVFFLSPLSRSNKVHGAMEKRGSIML